MRDEKPAGWYDEKYLNSTYTKPVDQCTYFDLYKSALSMIPRNKRISILDLGCGTGRFAKLVSDAGYKRFTGVDFSKVAIEVAKKYVPEYKFIVSDLFEERVVRLIEESEVFVLLEVLEHIEKDIELLEHISPGKLVIFSVPTYFSKSHVRRFLTIKKIHERFGNILDFSRNKRKLIRKPGRIFLFSSIRKEVLK